MYKLKQHPSYYADMSHTAISKTDNKPHTPYTYLIGWSKLDKWYYGVKFAKGCHPSELFNMVLLKTYRYETSSKVVHELILENGLPDIIQIRQIFNDRDSSIDFEHTVLKRLDAKNNNRFLNESNSKLDFNTTGTVNVKNALGEIIKVSVTDPRYISGELVSIMTGRVTVRDTDGNVFSTMVNDPRYISGELVSNKNGIAQSEKTIAKRVAKLIGVPRSEECKRKISIANTGNTMSEVLKLANSIRSSGKVTVKDSDGNTFQVSVDDPRYISGEVLFYRTGSTQSEETRAKIGAKHRGKIVSDETKLKMSESNKGKPRLRFYYTIISPSNETFETRNLKEFAKLHDLSTKVMSQYINLGKIPFDIRRAAHIKSRNTIGWSISRK